MQAASAAFCDCYLLDYYLFVINCIAQEKQNLVASFRLSVCPSACALTSAATDGNDKQFGCNSAD